MLPEFVSKANVADIIGKTENEARKFLEANGYTMRVLQKDGESIMGTCDLRTNRINVSVISGKVAALVSAG